MGAGRGGPHFELAGRGLPELVVPDVVGGAVFVLDDFQVEVGVFAEVGGDGAVVQTIGFFTVVVQTMTSAWASRPRTMRCAAHMGSRGGGGE